MHRRNIAVVAVNTADTSPQQTCNHKHIPSMFVKAAEVRRWWVCGEEKGLLNHSLSVQRRNLWSWNHERCTLTTLAMLPTCVHEEGSLRYLMNLSSSTKRMNEFAGLHGSTEVAVCYSASDFFVALSFLFWFHDLKNSSFTERDEFYQAFTATKHFDGKALLLC